MIQVGVFRMTYYRLTVTKVVFESPEENEEVQEDEKINSNKGCF